MHTSQLTLLMLLLVLGKPCHAIGSNQPSTPVPFRDLMHLVEQVDDADRKPLDEYAKIHGLPVDTWSASVDLKCKGGQGQAVLVGNASCVVTAAHVGTGKNIKCNMLPAPKECSIIVETKGVRTEYPVAQIFKSGICTYASVTPAEYEDWMILKLKKPVKGVKPYRLPASDKDLEPGTPIAYIGRSTDYTDPNNRSLHPRHGGDCQVRAPVASQNVNGSLRTDCDGSFGSSGGGVLSRGQDPVVYGVIVTGGNGGYSNLEFEERAGQTGNIIKCQYYGGGGWFSCSENAAPLTGEFYKAVKELCAPY